MNVSCDYTFLVHVRPLQVRDELLLQMEELGYLRVLFSKEGRVVLEIDRKIGAMLYQFRYGEEKDEHKNKPVDLLVNLRLNCGHKLLVTERTRSWIQASEMGVL